MPEQPASPSPPLGIFARRPAVAGALLLGLGILLHDRVPFHLRGVLVGSTIFTVIAAAVIRRRMIASIAVAGLIILLGIGIAQREHFHFAPSDIGQFASDEPHLTELDVCLLDDPQIVTGPASEPRQLPPKQTVIAKVLGINTWTGWTPVTGQLPVEIEQIEPSLQAGQTVRLLGMLQRPRAAMNPGEFDWAAYYRQQRILATFTVTRAGNIHILTDPGPSWVGWLRSQCRHAMAAGFTATHATQYALLDALVLGVRDPQLQNVEGEFKQTGMGYQLSVSGLHVLLLSGAVFWLCRFFRLSPMQTLFITTGFVLLYTAIALPSHSGIRSAILCIAGAIALCAGRSRDRAQFLSLAVIAMLVWHPMDLYSAGFHLSFAVVIVFLLLLHPLDQWMLTLRDPHDIAAAAITTKSKWRSFQSRAGQLILRGAQYSILAWLAALPLVVYHFGQASTWSLLASLLLLPLVVIALFGGVSKLIFTLLWPRWASEWATIAGWPATGLQAAVHQLARLPDSSVVLPPPSIGMIAVYYLLLFAPLLPYRWGLIGHRRWIVRLAPLLGVLAIFSPSFASNPATAHPDEFRITLLSLGAGQCAVIEPPGSPPVLIDAGSSTVSDVAQKIVEPFLRAQGETRINDIFLSHGDFDHISAAGELATDFQVQQFFTSYHFIKNSAGNIPDELLLDKLQQLDRTPKQIQLGEHYQIGNNAFIDVLWPPKVADLNSNNAGLVLKLTYAGRSVLFPADIQDSAFIGVLQSPRALQSDVLIAPHHGSSEDLTPAFLAAVHPQIILSSNFGRLSSKQKRFETMIGHTPLYRTPQCGAITLTITKQGTISINTFVKAAKPIEE